LRQKTSDERGLESWAIEDEGKVTLQRQSLSTFLHRCLFVFAAAALLAGCSTTGPAAPSYPRASPLPATSAETRSRVVTASWYGRGFNGNHTASGEVFHQTDLTAASKTLPLGSHVKVTNLANGRSVIVRINDRGPFVSGRSIDLSRTAAERIGMAREGVGTVKISELDDSRGQAATLSTSAAPTPVSYSGLGDTLSGPRYYGWLEPPLEGIWRVKMTLHKPQYCTRRYHHHSGIVSNPLGTWLMSALPHL
jgi:rare lipoprotein A